jgi:hypothetical protein
MCRFGRGSIERLSSNYFVKSANAYSYQPDLHQVGWSIFVSGLPEVFAKRASRTSTLCNQVMLARLHISLEAVSTHNLMRMWTTNKSRVDEWIEALDCELGACEAHHGGATLCLRTTHEEKRM